MVRHDARVIDAIKARHRIAGIALAETFPALDQRAAIGDVTQAPAVDSRQLAGFDLRRGSCGCCRLRRGRRCGNRGLRGAELVHRLGQLCELGHRLGLRPFELVETVVGPVGMVCAGLGRGRDAGAAEPMRCE